MSMLSKLRGTTARPKPGLRRFLTATSGVAAVELALATPFLVALAVGVVDFGLAWNRQMSLANAVRAGAQYAIVRKPVQEDVANIVDAVTATLPEGFTVTAEYPNVEFFCECPNTGVKVACTFDCGGGVNRQSFVFIEIKEDHEMLLAYPGIGGIIKLGDDATVRLN